MTASDGLGASDFFRPLLRWARVVFTPLSLLVIAFFIWQSRASLGATLETGAWGRLLAVVLLWMAGNLLAPLVSVHIFKSCGMKMDYLTAFHIHCGRLPAKYLPGGIWHSVGRANDYFGLGHDSRKVGSYFILENFLLVTITLGMSAGVVAPLVALPALQLLLGWLPWIMVLALLFFPLAARMMKKISQEFAVKAYLTSVMLLFVYWCMLGLIFACYISAFAGLQLTDSPIETAGIYVFSWSLGYMALFAPQGIGVAEFISGTLLGGDSAGELIAFLIGFRLLVLVADLASWGLAAVLKARRREYS